MRVIGKKLIATITGLLIMLLCASPAYAARSNGELIFAGDLAVGEIATVQIATSTDMDAMVVEKGDTPRLILMDNLGASCRYAPQYTEGSYLAYNLSELKPVIDSRTSGHGSYIFNISAPFVLEVMVPSGNRLGAIDAGITKGYPNYFWTRSSITSTYMYVVGDGCVTSDRPENTWHHVRPAFNLKSDTVLKYEAATSKYTVTTDPGEQAKAYFLKYGYYTTLLVPEGQAPAGYTAISGYLGFFYKQVNDRYVIAYAQEYTVPTNIGDLNIN